MLEQSCADLTLERDQLVHGHQILIHRTQEAERIIEALQMEKRDMMMKHNEETSTLRKRVLLLTEQLDAGPAPGMSANPSNSAGFGDFNAEMEALSMGAHEWDFGFEHVLQAEQQSDFAFDSQPQQQPVVEKKISPSTSVPARKSAEEQGQQQPLASSLLFMLLLCGAFVASRSDASSNAADLPITAEIRAAAPTVLNNLLAGSGSLQRRHDGHGQEPQPSHLPQPQLQPQADDRLDTLHHRLVAPTKQQDYDAAFALTSAQYAALEGEDVEYDESLPPKRTLAQAFSAESAGSTAEVYTRSLLFEQIPADVIARFKEMVAERGVWKEETQ